MKQLIESGGCEFIITYSAHPKVKFDEMGRKQNVWVDEENQIARMNHLISAVHLLHPMDDHSYYLRIPLPLDALNDLQKAINGILADEPEPSCIADY